MNNIINTDYIKRIINRLLEQGYTLDELNQLSQNAIINLYKDKNYSLEDWSRDNCSDD